MVNDGLLQKWGQQRMIDTQKGKGITIKGKYIKRIILGIFIFNDPELLNKFNVENFKHRFSPMIGTY